MASISSVFKTKTTYPCAKSAAPAILDTMHTPEFNQIPLGTPIPGDTPHAVSVSLPTMADVELFGYQDSDVINQLQTCYPRFGTHPFLDEAIDHLSEEAAPGRTTVAVNTLRCAEAIIDACDLKGITFESGPLGVVEYCTSRLKREKIAQYLRATGTVASSRRAEQFLVDTGILLEPYSEKVVTHNAEARITAKLKSLYPDKKLNIRLTNSGMSSIYALAEGIHDTDPTKTHWLIMGTAYSDTPDCIETAGGSMRCIPDPTDIAQLEEALADRDSGVAAIFTEAPNNPLLQTADLEQLAELAQKYDVPLIVDVSVAGSATVDVSPYADVILESLTKFASGHGDMMMGAILFDIKSPHYERLSKSAAPFIDKPFGGDIARLAYEIDGYAERARTIGSRTLQLVDYLQAQPEISTVHWSSSPEQKHRFQKIARLAEQPAGVITFEPKDVIGPLYDALPVAKGPSFGIEHIALHTPYMYLTHFGELLSDWGREDLRKQGLNPEMLRVSVSARSIDEQIGPYEAAFQQLRR